MIVLTLKGSYRVIVAGLLLIIVFSLLGIVTSVFNTLHPVDDREKLVQMTLEYALKQKRIPDYNLIIDPTNIMLSTRNIENITMPKLMRVNLILMSDEEIQEKADREGDFLRLVFMEITVSDSFGRVSLDNTWVQSENSTKLYQSGGGFTLTFHKYLGRWTMDSIVHMWVS